jgi:hypothetical protein
LNEDLARAPIAGDGGALKSLNFALSQTRHLPFMSGAPSQIELFDNKPKLKELTGTEFPNRFV